MAIRFKDFVRIIRSLLRRCSAIKRAAVPFLLFLFGFILGALCLVPLIHQTPDTTPAVSIASGSVLEGEDGAVTFSAKDTTGLLRMAAGVAEALKNRDYEMLASFVHPERGVTLTPYSTVDLETDQNFTADQIRDLKDDTTRYLWGYEDGRGEPIRMTIAQFLSEYIFSVDYTQATSVGVDEVVMSGNALENVGEAYPDCRYVDLCYPSLDPTYSGLDWCSLKLVFAPTQSGWYLVGLIHSQWTI